MSSASHMPCGGIRTAIGGAAIDIYRGGEDTRIAEWHSLGISGKTDIIRFSAVSPCQSLLRQISLLKIGTDMVTLCIFSISVAEQEQFGRLLPGGRLQIGIVHYKNIIAERIDALIRIGLSVACRAYEF